MIESRVGNIFESETEAIVNPVNCVGVMGRGLALQFKKKFPSNFLEYRKACKTGNLIPGKVLIVRLDNCQLPWCIVNFPTKRHWKDRSKLEDIEASLRTLPKEIERFGIKSIAIPPLGCGLGGLDWGEVRPMLTKFLGGLSGVRVVLYEKTR